MDKLISSLKKYSSFPDCGVKVDSREVCRGDVFIALRGTVYDGHDFMSEAIGRGASVIIAEYIPEGVPRVEGRHIIISDDTRVSLGTVSNYILEYPSSRLNVYGVTGTNGKTTTVFLIDGILNNASFLSGFVSTVYIKTRGQDMKRSVMTTPGLIELNCCLYDMAEDGKNSAVLEISSHALDQKRVSGIGLDAAVFTNISPEHLDYHKDMDTYLRDKSLIFGNLKPGGIAVLNADDERVISLKGSIPDNRIVTFGIDKSADVMASRIKLSSGGTEFELNMKGFPSSNVKTPLIGKHNVYNILAASAALLDSGVDMESLKRGIETVRPVPGRLESIRGDMPFSVFIDYAHTPNALENVLNCARSLADNKLLCVFGCGGDRDTSKRPVMGKIASEICDHVIITNDNPRTEDPSAILSQIENGMSVKDNYSIIENRKNAISMALQRASKGDIVIIAGKGHEDYQIIGRDVLRFDDKEVASALLKDMGFSMIS